MIKIASQKILNFHADVNALLRRFYGEKFTESSLTPLSLYNIWRREEAVSPREQHEAWCKNKIEEGWSHGEKFSAEQQTHPDLVLYDELPVSSRIKGEVFIAITEIFKKYYELEG